MRRLSVFCLLFILAMLQFSSVDAQKLADEWRVIKKVRTETNGQQYGFEYTYNQDGTIKTVRYLTATGALSLIINNFNFNRNIKPISYTLQYNNGSKTNVVLKYDNQGRISEVEKVFDNQTTIFNYRYSGTSIVVTEQTSNSSITLTGNKINFYTEQGNYNETSSDATTQIITSKITLKKSANRQLEPHPDNFMGGWEAPDFLGVVAFATEPEITATKNEYDLITTLTWVNRTGTRKNEYTYAKIKNSEPGKTIPIENIPVTVITTNINCAAGKEIVERILKSQDGVQSVKVDIRTGKLSLAYSSDGTPYTEIINLINEAGFNADRIKSTSPYKNPCKQPEPEEQTISITIQTNINCDEGKRKVESFLKEQKGVIIATADISSGKLIIQFNKSYISNEVINRIISSAGFDADRKKSTTPENNPCKKQPEPEEQATIVTIQTNINCDEGKRKVESFLKEQNGVISATADTRSGKLVVEYNKADISTEVINRIINSAGFDADRKKSTSPDKNPCIKKAEPVEKPTSVTLQTNINCTEGKQKIESLLKEQTGVLIANVDFRSGKLEMEYSKKEIASSQIIRLINQAGFDVENAKSKNPENNPCKKPEPVEKPVSVTLQTNINCVDGRQNIESLLKEQNGVVSVKVDIKTGKLIMEYNKDDVSTDEINRIINNAGFDVNGKKSTYADKNPCKKPEPAEKPISSTIRSNIKCEQGKQKVETLLLNQKGILNAEVDFKTGIVVIKYSKATISIAQIIELINQAGFNADENKTTHAEVNPCNAPNTTSINIQTNINCEEGKQNVESLLKEQNGVVSVKVDIKTGKLVIEYGSGITSAEISTLINRAGFNTEGKKTTDPDNNPCIKKPEPIITSTIKGRFFYRYKKENEGPKNTGLSFPAATKLKKLNPPFDFNIMVPNDEPYPDYIANNRFNKDDNTKPLKNVKIYFQYILMESSTGTPSTYEEIKDVTEMSYEYTIGKFVLIDGVKVISNVTVSNAVTTNSTGNFNFTFLNNYKLGYLGTNGKGINYFGVIRPIIHDQHNYYCSPDIIFFPKVGKTISMPDEIVFVNAYNVDVTIKSDKSIDQAAGVNKIIVNHPVQVLDVHKNWTAKTGLLYSDNDLTDDLASLPIEANSGSYTDKSAYVGGKVPVVDRTKTDKLGVAHFKNLLSAHTHVIQAMEDSLEGSLTYKHKELKIADGQIGKDKNGVDYELSNGFASLNSWVFNTDFKVTTVALPDMELKPKNPEIYLRAITKQGGKTKGIPYVTVTVTEYETDKLDKPKDKYHKTDENGYLHIRDLEINTQNEGGKNKVIGPVRRIKLSKNGFADLVVTENQNLRFGERFPAQVEQLMVGEGKVVGYVVNEKGEPVVCNIRVGVGIFIKTASNGWYEIDNCPVGYTSIEIVPAVDNYFSETIYQVIKEGYNLITNIKGNKESKVVVKEKLHRVQFKIVDENNKIITQSCTRVGIDLNNCYDSDASTGLTKEIAIASPDIEFHVRTEAPGYVTYDNYVEIPLSKTPKVITIKLIKGQLITGIVKDAKTLQPIKGARVYSVSGTNEDGEIQNETYTDANGKYTLAGVINQGTWMENIDAYLQLPVKVFAVKSGEPAYIRQVQSVQGLNGKGNADFNLNTLNAKAEIWGLPIEVTTATGNGDKIKLTGSFVKLPANSTFKPAIFNSTLPFKDVEVVLEKSGALTESKIKPVNNSIELEATAFKVTAFDKYACEIIGTGEENKIKKLTVTNDNGCGTINGFITSQLSSFNFSYNYTGKFLLDYGAKIPGKPAKPLPVLGVTECYVPISKFNLSALYGKSNFSIHNFNATMASGSYFDKEAFSINADVKLQIPLVGATTMPVGQIKVVSDSIIWNEYNGKINLPLEKWAVKGNGLRYDINQGGFRVIDGSLQTDLPQVPLKDLIINPTSIDLGLNSLTGNEILSLADVTPLHISPGAQFTLSYDAAAPFDQKPHYRINLTSPSETAAYISDLPGLDKNDKIKINTLSAYSDGVHKSVIVNAEKHRYYNVVSQNISGIEVGKDNFLLIGNTDLEIPGANNNVTGRFLFYKDAADKDRDANGVVCKVQNMQTDVEMPGKVKFNGNSFKLSDDLLVVKGDVLMYKNHISDAVKVRGTLTKTPDNIKMDIDPNEMIKMGGGGKGAMAIQNGGGNYVEGSTWSLVKFTAKPAGFKVDVKEIVNGKEVTTQKEILKDKQDLIDFVVNGAIESDKASKKAIAVEGIETPFGGLSISLDFEKKILQGSLELVDANIKLGPVTIQDGTIDMQIDGKGLILVGAITDAEIGIPLLNGFKSGIALGFYDGPLPQYMTNNLLDVTLYKELPGLENGLKGFYVNVMKSLSKDDLPKLPGPSLDKIPIVGSFVPTIDVSAGIDLRTSLNFANGTYIMIGGLAYAKASCLYDLELCTVGLAAGANGKFHLQYDGALTGSIEFEVEGKIIYCVGEAGVGIKLSLEKTSSNFKPSVSLK